LVGEIASLEATKAKLRKPDHARLLPPKSARFAGEQGSPMEISISFPDEVAERLHGRWHDLPRHALEAIVADAYREDVLTAAEVQKILGLGSRFETDAFLKQTGADLGYTWRDLEEDLRTYRGASRR
jgi:Uncharacterised protein family (UPF0175)